MEIKQLLLKEQAPKILLIYTGGTIGMAYNSDNMLAPLDFNFILDHIPEINILSLNISLLSFQPLIDSSDMQPGFWIDLAKIIEKCYQDFDGFVILHGTDTMAYTASALSFLLENLNKPVILTGSQLPIDAIRTDAKRNFVTALELAAAQENGKPIVPEVALYFNDYLIRGNRSIKVQSIYFDAFQSKNLTPLAQTGIKIVYQKNIILPYHQIESLKVYTKLEENIMVIKLFPGLQLTFLEKILQMEDLKGLIIESYGSGNAPSNEAFLFILKEAIQRGVIVLNISQTIGGVVEMNRYAVGNALEKIGVISGKDMTTAASVTKMMYLLAKYPNDPMQLRYLLSTSLRGEITNEYL